jgi:hypothetical protein
MPRSYNGRAMGQLRGRSASNGGEGTLQKPYDSKNLCHLADTKKGLRTSHFLRIPQSKQLLLRHLVSYKGAPMHDSNLPKLWGSGDDGVASEAGLTRK